MPLRIGFDMDGVLADFAGAFREIEARLFGAVPELRPEPPELEAQEEENPGAPAPVQEAPSPLEIRRRRERVWQEIHETSDFWTTLKPLDPDAVSRIHRLMIRKRWEVFFITQRPATAGDTVQRQTQRWLNHQGFDMPSVLVLSGSRGLAAAALRLSYHVDDHPQNCLDIVADSRARPLLVVPEPDAVTEASARKLGIAVVRSVGQALDLLEQVPEGGTEPGLLGRLAKMVRWN